MFQVNAQSSIRSDDDLMSAKSSFLS